MKPITLGAAPAGQGAQAPARWLRRLAAIAFAILLVLAIAWCGYWLYLTNRLEAGVQQWIAERRAEGYEISYAAIRSGGFPRSARVVLTNPAMAMPEDAPPLAWSAKQLIVGVDPFHPRRLHIDGPGAHALSIGSGADQVRTHAEAGHLRIVQEMGEPATVINVRDLALRPVSDNAPSDGERDAERETTTIARLDANVRREPQDAGGNNRVVVNAAEIVLPERPDLPLGNVIKSLAAEATVQGELALLPWPDALFRWRDAGGVVEVAALNAEYGPVALSGSGTVALDEAGQPVGAFTAQVSGLFQVIDALSASGHMGRGQAIAAKLALGVLTGRPDRRGPPGGQGPLNLPLTLQDRILSVGPVELMQLPEVHWLPATAR
jgi:hypothetical protein